MTKKEVTTYSQQTFEKIKHIDENGNEFWYARELQKALEYTEYGKFLPVIEKAIEACRKTGFDEGNHFAHVSEMVRIGSGAERKMDSYKLLGKRILPLKPGRRKFRTLRHSFRKTKNAWPFVTK